MNFALLLAVSAMLVAGASASAADLGEIRKEFPDGYDVRPYKATLAMKDLENLTSELSGEVVPVMLPDYARAVKVDDKWVEGARAAFVKSLRDPFSAQLREVRMMTNGAEVLVAACGLVNAKNGHGAYDGFQPFMALFISPYATSEVEGSALVAGDGVVKACRQMALD